MKRLLDSLACLVAALVELATSVVRLATVAVVRLTQRASGVTVAAPSIRRRRNLSVETGPVRALLPAPAAPTAPSAPATEEKLVHALAGLGFRAGAARAYAATVRESTKPLDALVRDGIVHLSK